jgi:hypothetical protein
MAMAQRLEPAGEEEPTLGEFASTGFAESDECPTVLATGEAGAACLRHPSSSMRPNRITEPERDSSPNRPAILRSRRS